VINELCD